LLNPSEDMDDFTVQKDKMTLLVMCGSQGSDAVFKHLLGDLDKG